MKPESKLRGEIKRALEAKGAFVRVLHGSAEQAGLPDLLVIYDGATLFLEVKVPGPDSKSRMTPLQLATAEKIIAAGGIFWCVRAVGEAIGRTCYLTYERAGYHAWRNEMKVWLAVERSRSRIESVGNETGAPRKARRNAPKGPLKGEAKR